MSLNIWSLLFRLEKEKSSLTAGQRDLSSHIDGLEKTKTGNERKIRLLEEQLSEASTRVRIRTLVYYHHIG